MLHRHLTRVVLRASPQVGLGFVLPMVYLYLTEAKDRRLYADAVGLTQNERRQVCLSIS
jgi:hypothetical protein